VEHASFVIKHKKPPLIFFSNAGSPFVCGQAFMALIQALSILDALSKIGGLRRSRRVIMEGRP
jgi:hypothetical protein